MRKIGILLGIIVGIMVIIIFMKPTIEDFIGNIRYTEISSASYKAYVVYMYADSKNISNNRTVKIVFNKCVVTITNNSFDTADYQNDDTIERVTFDSEEATGTYESGIYTTWDEGERIVQDLEVGDSLEGLHEVTVPDQLPGYTFYGRLEQCDVYVESE